MSATNLFLNLVPNGTPTKEATGFKMNRMVSKGMQLNFARIFVTSLIPSQGTYPILI